jgi:hypothetical protein
MGRESDREYLNQLRARAASRTFVRRGNLILTQKQAEEYRENFCGGCGGSKGQYPKLWFGETFCNECVEKWRSGQR